MVTAGEALDRVPPAASSRIAFARLTRLVVRRRWPLIAALAALSAWLSDAQSVDMAYFAKPGGQLLSGHFGNVYASAGNQGGPLQLVGSRLTMSVSHHVGPLNFVFAVDPWAVAIVNVGLVLLAMATCRAGGPHDADALARRELLVGSSVLLWLTPEGLWNGHPLEVLIPIFWIGGLVLLRGDRWIAAAVLFGLTAGVAPWAVLAFPCLLAANRLGAGLRTAALASVIAICQYSPFVLSGHFRMLHHRWPVHTGSLIHVIFPDQLTAGWGLRLGQAVVVGLGCGYAAWRCRRNPMVVALAPLTAAVLRVATDPVQLNYYWVPVGAAAVGLVAVVPAGPVWTHLRLRVLLLLYLSWTSLSVGLTSPLAVVCLLLVAWVLVATGSGARQSEGATKGVVPG